MRAGAIGLVICLLLFVLFPPIALSCTTFGLHDGHGYVLGKNYDWQLERGLVLVNKRGVIKKAMPHLDIFSDQYASWRSKYGSLTFNQYGREIPTGGMNEVGLVIHLMRLNATQFPQRDARPCIHSLQWIQYQLDNHRTVKEVIASALKIRMYPHSRRIHYLVQDQFGDCASIEFLYGKLVYHTRETLPVRALANSTYAESVAYLKQHKRFREKSAMSSGNHSLDRFARAAELLNDFCPQKHPSGIDYAFHILDRVAQPHTQWQIVYDQQGMRVYFKTASNSKIRYVDVAALDFACDSPVKILDVSAELAGNVTERFSNYSLESNKRLLHDAYKGTNHLRNVTDDIIEKRAQYPETMTTCRP